MATATATYTFTFTSGHNTDLFNGSIVQATLRRSNGTTPPANAYIVSCVEEITDFYMYNGKSRFYIGFSGGARDYYGSTTLFEKFNQDYSVLVRSSNGSHPNNSVLQVGNGDGVPVVLTQENDQALKAMRLTSQTTLTWTITYDVQATASDATYTNPVTAGNSITVNITNSDISTSTLSHRIDFSIGNYSHTINLSTGVTQTTYSIPTTWVNAIPNSESGICTMMVSTYSEGTFIGSKSYSVTIQVPSTLLPTIGSITATRINNSVPSGWGIYVQNQSGVTITANNCSGAQGSTITKYVITGGMSATQSTNSFTLDPIQSSGTVTFTVTITDSRGRTASGNRSISVYAYSVPSITATSAYKCTSNGTRSNTGTYLAIQMTATYSSLNSNNSLTLSGYYRVMGTSAWSDATVQTNGVTTIVGGSLDPEQNYEVKFVAQDSLSTVDKTIDINSVAYTLHFKNGGQGMGVGQINTIDSALQINDAWTIYHGTYLVPRIVVSSSAPTAKTGQIWLKPVT